MRFFPLFLIFAALHLVARAQPKLYPIKDKGLWGYIDPSGQLRVPAQYQQVGAFFPNGLAVVRQNGLLGAIDSNGRLRIPCEYQLLDTAAAFAQYLIAEKNQRWQLISFDNELILDSLTGRVEAFGADYFTVENERGLSLMHLKNGILCPFAYHHYQQLEGNFFTVQSVDSNSYGLINPNGKELIPPIYDTLIYKSGLVFAKRDYRWGVMDTNQNRIFGFLYDYVEPINGACFVLRPNTSGVKNLYHKDSSTALVEHIHSARIDPRGFIRLQKWENIGVADPNGRLLLPIEYKKIETYSRDSNFFIAHHQNGNKALLDNQFKLLIEPDYQAIEHYDGASWWRVKKGGLWGIFDTEKQELALEPRFQQLSALSYSVALAQMQDSFWVINRNFESNWSNVGLLKDLNLYANTLTYQLDRKGKQVIHFDSLGNLSEQNKYSNYNKVKVTKREEREVVLPTRTGPSARAYDPIAINNQYFWVFDKRRQVSKWGIRDSLNQRWKLPPTYASVLVFNELGFSLGYQIEVSEATFTFDKADCIFLGAYTIINNEKALPVSKPEFLSIKTADFEAGNNAARCIFTSGEHGLVSKSGKIIARGFVYIGEFHEGKARACKKGRLASIVELGMDSLQPIEPLQKYLSDFGMNYQMSVYGSNQYISELNNGGIVCENGKWGFIDEQGSTVIPFEYDFVSNFHQKSSSVLRAGKWGLLSDQNQLLLQPTFANFAFLPNSDRNLYQITAQDLKIGCVDTLGRLVLPMEYEQLKSGREGLLLVKKNGLWGYWSPNGQPITECQFHEARAFKEGRAAVFIRSRWGFIDSNGRMAVKALYPRVGDFHEGKAWVRVRAGVLGYVNPEGELLFSSDWSNVGDFVDGHAPARDAKGAWGIIDEKGGWVCKPNKRFSKIILQKGLARAKVQMGDRFALIDLQGKILSKTYAVMRDFSEGKAAVRKNFLSEGLIQKEDDWGAIDTNGLLTVPLQFQRLGDFHHDRALYYEPSKGWGYINGLGEMVVEAQYFSAQPFEQNRAVVFSKHNASGLIDTSGKLLMRTKFNKIIAREENICLLRAGRGHYYYLTENLKRVSPYVFEEARPFRHQVAPVKQANLWGLINSQGLWLVSPKYQNMGSFEHGFAKVSIETRYGVANTQGKIIIPPSYEYIHYQGDGVFRVENGDQLGYINLKGDWIWPMRG